MVSADSVTTLSKATGPSYFALRLPRFYAPATDPHSPIVCISPGQVDPPRPSISPGSNVPKARRPSLLALGPSKFTGRASSRGKDEGPGQQRHSSSPSDPDTRKSSKDDKGSKMPKLPFKLPSTFARPEKDRSKSDGGVSNKSRKSKTGSSGNSGEVGSTRAPPPIKLSIEPLPPPITRQLFHSVGYNRKITIETDFEDSRPARTPEPEPSEDQQKENPLSKLYANSKKCLGSSIPSNRTRKRRPSIYLRRAVKEVGKNGTKEVLQRTNSLLRQAVGKDSPTSRLGTTGSSGKKREGRGRRLFSIAGLNIHRTISNSSSIINAKRGKTPATTPEEAAMYVRSDRRPHMKLDISDPTNKSSFLPSEAQRLGTPPTPNTESEWTFHKRGFFFDYTAPPKLDAEGEDSSENGKWKQLDTEDAFCPQQLRRGKKISETAWYTMQMDMVEHQVEVEIRKTEIQEYDVPEHLPSSPLCPRNPKHRSQGKGACMFHGSDRGRNGSAKSVASESQ
jgi:hypothetical protein